MVEQPMSASTRIAVAFLLGAGTILAIVAVLVALGVADGNGAAGGTLGAAILAALVLLGAGTAGFAILRRGQVQATARFCAGVDRIWSTLTVERRARGGVGDIETRLENAAKACETLSGQLAALAQRVVEFTGEAGGAFDQFEAGAAAQVSAMTQTSEAGQTLRAGLTEVATEMERIDQRIRESGAATLRMDRSNARASELINGLAVSIEQASLATREGDRGARAIARDLESLSTGVRTARVALDDMKDGAEHACADARHVANTMASLELEAQRIGETIEAVIRGSDSALASNDRILGVTETLESRLGGIDEIIGVIRHLAERTKLLSINASIIATEAGEHGRAFAVVANEIKDLAGSTSRAIAEISSILSTLKEGFANTIETVHASRTDVNRGVSIARDAVVMLRSIPEQVHSTAAFSNEIVMRNEGQVKRGVEIGSTFERMSEAFDQVGELLRCQTARDESTLEMYLAIGRSAEQVHRSAKEHTASSSEMVRVAEHVAEEFRQLGRRVAGQIAAVEKLLDVADQALLKTKDGARHAEALSLRMSEICQYSTSLSSGGAGPNRSPDRGGQA
jgi:methyl-accepting chemotaxis protein